MRDFIRKLMFAIRNELKNDILDNFRTQSFDGQKWKPRSSKNKSDRRDKENTRALLVESGKLRRSIRTEIRGSNSIVAVSDSDYAGIHNKGGTVNHPGGTPYIITGKTSRARGSRSRLRNFGKNRAVFLKKDGNYPEGAKFTKPHKIGIPKRQFAGYSKDLGRKIAKTVDKQIMGYLEGLKK